MATGIHLFSIQILNCYLEKKKTTEPPRGWGKRMATDGIAIEVGKINSNTIPHTGTTHICTCLSPEGVNLHFAYLYNNMFKSMMMMMMMIVRWWIAKRFRIRNPKAAHADIPGKFKYLPSVQPCEWEVVGELLHSLHWYMLHMFQWCCCCCELTILEMFYIYWCPAFGLYFCCCSYEWRRYDGTVGTGGQFALLCG